jgi:hypothetical protein
MKTNTRSMRSLLAEVDAPASDTDDPNACPMCGEKVGKENLVEPPAPTEGEKVCRKCASELEDEQKHGTHQECYTFDKFMDRILVQEGSLGVQLLQEDSPMRVRQSRIQERPLNRTRFLKG